MGAIVYLLQVSACMGLFYGFYYLMISRFTFFTINRWYLVATLILSFAIPLLTITVRPDSAPIIKQAVYVNQLQTFQAQGTLTYSRQQVIEPVINLPGVLKVGYLSAVAVLFIRLIVMLAAFFSTIKSKKSTKIGNVHILYGDKKLNNGSFLNYIFLNDDELSIDEIQQIIEHEMLHVKLLHSVDRILVKIAQIFLWFNPFVYLYARAIEENHEFEVDREIGLLNDKSKYADMLLHLSVARQGMLYNSFSMVPLKKRITMLFTKPTNHMKKVIYLLILPVVMISCLAFARIKNEQDKFSAINGVDKLGPHPLVLINGKVYSDDILYNISPSCISSLGLFLAPVTNPRFAKYGSKVKDGVVDMSVLKEIIYLTEIEKDNMIKERSVPKSQFYTRLHLKENNGKSYDKIIIKVMRDGSVSSNLGVADKAIFLIDNKLYAEDEINTLSAEKVKELSSEYGVDGVTSGKYGLGVTTAFHFTTIKQTEVADTIKQKTKPVLLKNKAEKPKSTSLKQIEAEKPKPNATAKPAVISQKAFLLAKPAVGEPAIRIDEQPFFTRMHYEDSDGKNHDKITFKLSDGSASANLGEQDKAGAFIDGEFYDEEAIKKLPPAKTSALVISHSGFDAKKIPDGPYAVPFSFATREIRIVEPAPKQD
ncbi:M56 family metallopeptidase [Mucilaginibacter sp. UYCu711]|uniref:M56 family metallopeptidase n=1 Tax=Mucilaginibacter sp. UYCu711 TaxID=3156339 RepID=UPI003D221B91